MVLLPSIVFLWSLQYSIVSSYIFFAVSKATFQGPVWTWMWKSWLIIMNFCGSVFSAFPISLSQSRSAVGRLLFVYSCAISKRQGNENSFVLTIFSVKSSITFSSGLGSLSRSVRSPSIAGHWCFLTRYSMLALLSFLAIIKSFLRQEKKWRKGKGFEVCSRRTHSRWEVKTGFV